MRLPLPPVRPAAGHLDAGYHDVVGVQEAVLLEADVHEGRLEPGKDVVDLPLVDVAHDRARSAALYVELADPPLAGPSVSPSVLSGGRSLRFQDGDTGFATVGRDEYLLSQKFLS